MEPVVRGREGDARNAPGHQRGEPSGLTQRQGEPQRRHERHVGVARGHGETERQARARRPLGLVVDPDHHPKRHAQKQNRRGVLPKRLARRPNARPQGEHQHGDGGLSRRMAASDRQEQHARCQTGKERGRKLSRQRGARLVEIEEGPSDRKDGRGHHRRQHRIDGQLVVADLASERRGNLGILVEVEVELADQARRDSLGGPCVAGPDRAAVRDQHDEDDRGEKDGCRERRPQPPLKRGRALAHRQPVDGFATLRRRRW